MYSLRLCVHTLCTDRTIAGMETEFPHGKRYIDSTAYGDAIISYRLFRPVVYLGQLQLRNHFAEPGIRHSPQHFTTLLTHLFGDVDSLLHCERDSDRKFDSGRGRLVQQYGKSEYPDGYHSCGRYHLCVHDDSYEHLYS